MVPLALSDRIEALAPLKPVGIGTPVAVMKGSHAVPAPALALSPWVNRAVFPEIRLDRHQALHYLRGGTGFSIDGPDGYCLMTRDGLPLGFSKKTSGRFNNLFPKSWYIRKPASGSSYNFV